jgi:hypothetical protein
MEWCRFRVLDGRLSWLRELSALGSRCEYFRSGRVYCADDVLSLLAVILVEDTVLADSGNDRAVGGKCKAKYLDLSDCT